MKIIISNPNATARVKASCAPQTAAIYLNRISRLDECSHLSNSSVDLYVKRAIFAELMHPSNIIKSYRLVNPAILKSKQN